MRSRDFLPEVRVPGRALSRAEEWSDGCLKGTPRCRYGGWTIGGARLVRWLPQCPVRDGDGLDQEVDRDRAGLDLNW